MEVQPFFLPTSHMFREFHCSHMSIGKDLVYVFCQSIGGGIFHNHFCENLMIEELQITSSIKHQKWYALHLEVLNTRFQQSNSPQILL